MFRSLILASTLLLAEASAGVLETRDGKSFSGAIQLVAPDKLGRVDLLNNNNKTQSIY